ADALRTRIAAFRKELRLVADGDAGGLHRGRIALRRLREIAPLIPVDRKAARDLGRKLRKATRRFGQGRELDMLAALAAEPARDADDSRAFRMVRAALSRARVEARAHLADALPASKQTRLADLLDELANEVERQERRSRETGRAVKWALEAR